MIPQQFYTEQFSWFSWTEFKVLPCWSDHCAFKEQNWFVVCKKKTKHKFDINTSTIIKEFFKPALLCNLQSWWPNMPLLWEAHLAFTPSPCNVFYVCFIRAINQKLCNLMSVTVAEILHQTHPMLKTTMAVTWSHFWCLMELRGAVEKIQQAGESDSPAELALEQRAL